MKPSAKFLVATILASGAAFANPAFAQQEPAEEQGATEDKLGEIIVTAQRREEKLQDVPIAATALSAEGLREKAVTRLSDLQFAAPSLSVSQNGVVQQANIRGIGIASGQPSVANGVATYVNGIFQPPIVQTNSFFDIASVEVFRGPQGTLVGSNSTGGAIFINSINPSLDKVSGYAGATYGNYNAVELIGAVNLPASDTLALRVAGQYRRHDSYFTDVGPFKNDAGKLDEKSARISLLWKPGNFQALVKSEFLEQKTGSFAYRPILGTALVAGRVGGIRTLSYNRPQAETQQAMIHSAELKYELASGITLRSVTGYQDKTIKLTYDADGTQLIDNFNDQYVRERQTSQEFNIISPTEGAFDWILGAYYQRNRINVDLKILNGGFPVDVINNTTKITTGVFAQGNYQLSDQFEVQLGVRYSHFKATGDGSVKIGRGIPGFPPGGLQVSDLTGGNSDGRMTGKLALNYKINDNNLLYLFAARGYKPGGFNSAVSKFNPETVNNYEIGWKGTLADGHLRTQFDLFYNDYKGFQFEVLDVTTGQNGVSNLPDAKIKGMEFALQAKFGGFSADATLAYVDSKLPLFRTVNTLLLPPGQVGQLGPQCAAGVPNGPTCYNYGAATKNAGNGPNLLSPKWTYNLGAQYAFAVSDGVTFTPRINYAFMGSQFTRFFYDPVTDRLASRGLLSARAVLSFGKWEIEAYGRNLANKEYVDGQLGSNEFYGAPREFGMRVRVDF